MVNNSTITPKSSGRLTNLAALAFAFVLSLPVLSAIGTAAQDSAGGAGGGTAATNAQAKAGAKGSGGAKSSARPKALAAATPAASSAKEASQAEAERLYKEALEFYQVERYARAFDLGQQCCALAPHNARDRGALAVFASKDRPLLYSLSTAREASRLAPGDANFLTNLGSLLQKNGQRPEAVERYKKAEAINNGDYRPKLGIAQCFCIDGTDGMAIAQRELKAACDTSENSMAKWANLGTTYYALCLYPDAINCFNRALKLEPQNYDLLVLRLKAALAVHDVAMTKALCGVVVSDKLFDKEVALGLALVPDGDFSPDQKHKLVQICQRNFFGQAEFFYQLARNFEAGSHLDIACECYQEALKAMPGECQYIVSEIGNRLAAGRSDEAVEIWRQSSAERRKPLLPGAMPIDKSGFAHVFDCVGELLQSESAGVRLAHVKFTNLKCGCRRPVLQAKLTYEPGVVFAHIEDAKEYPAVIVYDAKKTTLESVLKHVRREEDVIETTGDSPVQSIPELVQLVQSASDKPDKHIFSLWSFLPPPMELPK